MGDDGQADQACEEVAFEEALGRLEAIAGALDEGNLSLQESIQLFEEGMDLVKLCQTILDSADGRIEELIELKSGVTQRVCLDDETVE